MKITGWSREHLCASLMGHDVGAVDNLTVRDAYGVRAATGGVVPFGYTGHAEDPTGLVWGRARYLAVATASWTSDDPVFDEPRCAYGSNDPSRYTDQSGQVSAQMAVLIGGCLGAVVSVGVSAIGVELNGYIYAELNRRRGGANLSDRRREILKSFAEGFREAHYWSLKSRTAATGVALVTCGVLMLAVMPADGM